MSAGHILFLRALIYSIMAYTFLLDNVRQDINKLELAGPVTRMSNWSLALLRFILLYTLLITRN
jgi:uncharacterized membrane protein